MADFITGLREVIQDLLAPGLKAIQAKQDALSKQVDLQYESMRRQIEVQHDALMTNMDAFRAEMRSEFATLRTNNSLEVYRQVSPLSERLALVEKKG
jgi:hypothetical protein